jgi:hypothetical protein
MLLAVKVTNPAAVAAMEGFTATRFPPSSSTRTQLGSNVLAGRRYAQPCCIAPTGLEMHLLDSSVSSS